MANGAQCKPDIECLNLIGEIELRFNSPVSFGFALKFDEIDPRMFFVCFFENFNTISTPLPNQIVTTAQQFI